MIYAAQQPTDDSIACLTQNGSHVHQAYSLLRLGDAAYSHSAFVDVHD